MFCQILKIFPRAVNHNSNLFLLEWKTSFRSLVTRPIGVPFLMENFTLFGKKG